MPPHKSLVSILCNATTGLGSCPCGATWGDILSVSRMDAVGCVRVTGLPLGTNGRPLPPSEAWSKWMSSSLERGEKGRHSRSSHRLLSISRHSISRRSIDDILFRGSNGTSWPYLLSSYGGGRSYNLRQSKSGDRLYSVCLSLCDGSLLAPR